MTQHENLQNLYKKYKGVEITQDEALKKMESLKKKIKTNFEIIHNHPKNIQARFENGLFSRLLGQNKDGIGYFFWVQNSPYSAIHDYFQPENHLEYIDFYDEAIQCFEVLLKNKKQNDKIHYIIGLILKIKKQYTDALSNNVLAFEINQSEKWYSLEFGNILLLQEQYEQAIEWYETALDQDSNFLEALSQKCIALLKSGINQRAMNIYERIKQSQINQGKIQCLYRIGKALQEKEVLEIALDCYNQIIKINPQEFSAFNKQSEVLIQQKQFLAARQLCNLTMKKHLGVIDSKQASESVTLQESIQLALKAYKEAIK